MFTTYSIILKITLSRLTYCVSARFNIRWGYSIHQSINQNLYNINKKVHTINLSWFNESFVQGWSKNWITILNSRILPKCQNLIVTYMSKIFDNYLFQRPFINIYMSSYIDKSIHTKNRYTYKHTYKHTHT